MRVGCQDLWVRGGSSQHEFGAEAELGLRAAACAAAGKDVKP